MTKREIEIRRELLNELEKEAHKTRVELAEMDLELARLNYERLGFDEEEDLIDIAIDWTKDQIEKLEIVCELAQNRYFEEVDRYESINQAYLRA